MKEKILFFIYDILFTAGLILYLPIYALRGKINFFSLKQRLSILGHLKIKNAIWIQAVSVGEVIAAARLIEKINKDYGYPIVLSTTTLTGNSVARKRYSETAHVIYFPLDISFVLRRVLDCLRPLVFIALETELWPNLFYHLEKRNIPVIILNGRISDKAFYRYLTVRPVIAAALRRINTLAVQNQAYKERFTALGYPQDKIRITGNLKYEGISLDEKHHREIEKKFGQILKPEGSTLFIAASTHQGEEEDIIPVYRRLRAQHPGLVLLLAPRHLRRIAHIEKIIRRAGLRARRLSTAQTHEPGTIYILDRMGELMYFYRLCDLCFVGGSLTARGGHNILEPIHLLKPTCFGPHMENFRDIARTALEFDAAIQVKDKNHLQQALSNIITTPALRQKLKRQCQALAETQKDNLQKNIALVNTVIKSKIAT